MTARLSAMHPTPRRGLSREEAAKYIGVSATKFDELVAGGHMPSPKKRDDGQKVWDVQQIDQTLAEQPKRRK